MKRFSKKGFTLIELMITLTILSIFSIYLYGAYFAQLKEYNDFNNTIHAQFYGKKAMDVIIREIRNSSTVTSSLQKNLEFVTTNSRIIRITAKNVLVYENGSLTLKSSITPLDISEDESKITNAEIYLDNGDLKYNDGTLLCNNVKSVTIEHNNDLVYITLVLNINNNSDDVYSIKTAVNIVK